MEGQKRELNGLKTLCKWKALFDFTPLGLPVVSRSNSPSNHGYGTKNKQNVDE